MKFRNYFFLENQQLEYIYKAMDIAIYSIIILALTVNVTFDGEVDAYYLTVWVMVNISIAICIIILGFVKSSMALNKENRFRFYTLFYLLVVFSGIAWGSSVFFIFPQKIELQILLLLLTGGILSGAAVSMVARLEIFYSYLFLMITPFIYTFFTQETPISTAIFVSLILYILILLVISKKSFDTINANIKLSYQNDELVRSLELKVEEVKNINEAKSTFLSMVSHEIRTPLNAVIGFIRILKKDETDEIKSNYLDIVDKSSHTLLHVLNDVLDITKIESGKFTLENVTFDPEDELTKLYELYAYASEGEGIHLVNSIASNLPNTISTDKLRLKQIISNLLSNAIKFTPKDKQVELIVLFKKEQSHLYVEVRDAGIGISQSRFSRVVEEFTQADETISRKFGGTGLGLSIVSKLLHLLGSKLEIESKLDEGSRFSFEIPVKVIKSSTKVKRAEETVDFKNRKVLVAEDNKTNQMLIDIVLQDMNLDVTLVNDGVEVEKVFKEKEFEIVLMDINMPNKNGTEAMQTLKKLKPLVPIVALTANAVAGDKEKYLGEGFDEYLSKPIEPKALVKVLKKYLK